jgi:hypothetical protein
MVPDGDCQDRHPASVFAEIIDDADIAGRNAIALGKQYSVKFGRRCVCATLPFAIRDPQSKIENSQGA